MQQFAGMDGTEARETIGASLYDLAAQLYPICRSITGDGVRETLRCLSQYIGIETTEVPTGTQVFDWTIPKEWNIRDAYIAGADGQRVVDFRRSNLHVLNYSTPVRGRFSLEDLKPHIYTLPEQPDLIPYRTSYYAERWGFSMTHNQLLSLFPGQYDVVIDSSLKDGHLTYGEYVHRGELADEVLLSAHICHPSLANDNCSGLALLAHLARHLASARRRLSYRILFAPGTIGAITWLAQAGEAASRIKHGLILSCVGDGGGPHYKLSRRGDALIDRAMAHVLAKDWPQGCVVPFSPYGYDERQYCSPGFDLPVGLLQRSRFGTFPEYHTSGDNLDFIAPRHLEDSYRITLSAIDILERNRVLVSTSPYGEPQLGCRGLYQGGGGDTTAAERNMALLWVMNLADGRNDLLAIAERSGLAFGVIADAASGLEKAGLLAPGNGTPAPWCRKA